MKAIVAGCLTMAFGIGLGAFGAHALKILVDEESLRIFETGVRYQIYHAFGLIILGILSHIYQTGSFKTAAYCFGFGILLFSGSLYILTFREFAESLKIVGIITPIGGLLFIAGWLLTAYRLLKLMKPESSDK